MKLKLAAGSNANNVKVQLKKTSSVLGSLILEREVGLDEISLGVFDYGNYSIHVNDGRYFSVSQPIYL